MHSTRPYRHGNLPVALVAAARQILDENGFEAVGLRETARRVGVSATAAYRHFTSKEDLLASVAAEGFRELGAAMERETRGPNHLSRAADDTMTTDPGTSTRLSALKAAAQGG